MKKKAFDELLKSVRQGGAILKSKMKAARSFNSVNPDVKKIRSGLGLSQDQFAKLMGIQVATLRNWEQGRRQPLGPAKILLGVAAIHPNILADVARLYK